MGVDTKSFLFFQEKAKGPENEMAKMEKLLSLVREPSAKNWFLNFADDQTINKERRVKSYLQWKKKRIFRVLKKLVGHKKT